MFLNCAKGQQNVCVQGFKVSIFCVAKGKHSKPQKITLIVKLYEERRGCGHLWMCSEFSSLRQRHLYNAVERASAIEKLQYEHNGSTDHTYSRCQHYYSVMKCLSVLTAMCLHRKLYLLFIVATYRDAFEVSCAPSPQILQCA